jgi:hypothetical protein
MNMKIMGIVVVICVTAVSGCRSQLEGAPLIGPGGGAVFYDKGNYEGGWRYLECSLEAIGEKAWGAQNMAIVTSTDVGAGRANTAAILAADPSAAAARACVDYRGGGKNDWWLPSKDELDSARNCYTNRAEYFFWSSSAYSNNASYCRNWGGGYGTKKKNEENSIPEDTTYIDRQTVLYVLAVRAF